MSILVPERRFHADRLEMMDRPANNPQLLADDLRNLRRINKYLGGISAVRNSIVGLFDMVEPGKRVDILDLATGSADHPIETLMLARSLGRNVRIVAVDKNPQILRIAVDRVRHYPEISVEEGDLLHLRFSDKSFDIVLCSLAIHHFSRDDAVKILREVNRISRVGFIVNDLNRSWPGAWTAWAYTHLTSRNPLTLHDSYVSVLRAFTRAELRSMAEEAGVEKFTIETHPFFRLILVANL